MDKGTVLEIEVMDIIRKELGSNSLGIDPSRAKLIHRPKFFSKERSSNIIFDISLELFREGAETPFFVWIWECKNYEKKVPVDDVEEFHSKLEQIGLHRTKGTMACRNGYQQGAIDYAQSKGIGLVRILASGTMIRLMEEVIRTDYERVVSALQEEDTTKLDFMFYALSSSGFPFHNKDEFILKQISETLQESATEM